MRPKIEIALTVRVIRGFGTMIDWYGNENEKSVKYDECEEMEM